MSVGFCGPFGEGDDFDIDSAYDALSIEADALRVENRLLHLELKKMREVIKDITEALNNTMKKEEA